MMLLEDEEWSDRSARWIARQCKVTHTFVNNMINHTGRNTSIEGELRDHTGNVSSMETERTFIHHKTGKPTTMNVTNIGSNNNKEGKYSR